MTTTTRDELQVAKFPEVTLHETGLEFTKPISVKKWRELGRYLSFFDRATAWACGDWAVYGEQNCGDDYADEIAQESGYDINSIRVCQWVAEHVPPESRRPHLSWSHHRAVASLEPTEQATWLDRAENDGMSTRELHQAIQAIQAGKGAANRTPMFDETNTALVDAIREVLRGWVVDTALERAVGDVMRVLRERGVEA